MYSIGISCYYHDSSLCVFKDGKLIFACVTDRARNAVKNLQAFIKTETEPFLKLANAKEGSKNYNTGQEVGKFFRNLMSMKNFSEKEKVFFNLPENIQKEIKEKERRKRTVEGNGFPLSL